MKSEPEEREPGVKVQLFLVGMMALPGGTLTLTQFSVDDFEAVKLSCSFSSSDDVFLLLTRMHSGQLRGRASETPRHARS
jgi:hypothetical protein